MKTPGTDANPREQPHSPAGPRGNPAVPAGTGSPSGDPRVLSQLPGTDPASILQHGALRDQASHKDLLLLTQRKEDHARWVGSQLHQPPSSPGTSGVVPIASSLRKGLSQKPGKEGEKCKDPALQKRDGCGRRGLSLVIVIAGELDQQAIFSHLPRKIQVRANS